MAWFPNLFLCSAFQEVLNNSDHHPILLLSNLVEGTYTFHLRVTDAKGESDVERTTVEVKPGESVSVLYHICLQCVIKPSVFLETVYHRIIS